MASQSPPPSPTPGKHCYMLPFPGGMRRKLRRWRHFSASSVRLFKYWGFWKVFDIKSFSVKHKSQVFPPFTYGVAVLRIDQSMSGTGFNPASHTCVASVVSCLWLLFRNERLCKKSSQQTTQITTKVDRMETTRQEVTAVLHNRPDDREDP